jgi:hypothetical protein
MIVASQIVLATLGIQEFRNWQVERVQTAHQAEYADNREQFQQDPQAYQTQLAQIEQQIQMMQQRLDTMDKDSEQFAELRGEYKAQLEALKDKQMAVEGTYQPMLPSRINQSIGEALEDFKAGEIEFVAPVTGPEGQPAVGPDGKPVLEEKYENHEAMVEHDLGIVQVPYVAIGMVVIAILLVFAVSKLPHFGGGDHQVHFFTTVGNLLRNGRYVGGVIAQMFYVGAQIMCWTFIIHYATINLNMTYAEAQWHNVIAMIIFCSSRFICTYLLKYIKPGALLMILAVGGMLTTTGAIFLSGFAGLYSLIAISACMSLMFPTIYGIALDGLGEEAKLGSAGLIFAIVGGALMPPLQGRIIDLGDDITGMINIGFTALPSVNVSFVLPLICFVIIAGYGFYTNRYYSE